MSDDIFIPILVIWGISAVVSGLIANDKDRGFINFAVITFFFLGPLGPGFALLATNGAVERAELSAANRRKIATDRQRFICPRCAAQNDIPQSDATYACWRCGETRKVTPRKSPT